MEDQVLNLIFGGATTVLIGWGVALWNGYVSTNKQGQVLKINKQMEAQLQDWAEQGVRWVYEQVLKHIKGDQALDSETKLNMAKDFVKAKYIDKEKVLPEKKRSPIPSDEDIIKAIETVLPKVRTELDPMLELVKNLK